MASENTATTDESHNPWVLSTSILVKTQEQR